MTKINKEKTDKEIDGIFIYDEDSEKLMMSFSDSNALEPVTLEKIKTFIYKKIKKTEDNYKKELLEILKEPSYIGVLENNEQRRGYEKAHTEIINLIKNK